MHFSGMSWLPYHHDWKLAFQSEPAGIRLHWFGRYAGYPDWSIPTARLAADMVSFFFVEKGSCWSIVNGRKWTLNEGDLFVVCGADEFTYGHNPAKPHVSLSACLALQQGSVANSLLQRKFERRYALPNPAEFVAQFEKVLTTLGSTLPYRDLQITGALLQWLAYVMSCLRPALDNSLATERSVVDKVLAAEAWANVRLQEVITLEEWARAVGLHPTYFRRILKRETGLSPMEWLNQRRLQMARQYLAGTRKSVAEIAQACGFQDQFYFSRVFRRHFGQSPLQYRKGENLK
jgi:AraC-like DNA-binding protein